VPDCVVVGAGQAGLAASHELAAAGVEHVVLERGRVGETWRGRWDSFCLVTPNWSVRLPGGEYGGDDPHGYMPRDEIVDHLERYAGSFEAPLREGVEVTRLKPEPGGGGFRLETSAGELQAKQVVLSTGAYQRPHRPPGAATLPPNLAQLDLPDYRNPSRLPAGAVLIVGSGQSGCQLAEELHEAGREVHLACGRAPWTTRRIGEHDFVWWALHTGYLDDTVAALSSNADRLFANVLASGHGGGHDLHFRTLQDMGVTLHGRFLGAERGRARFADDLAASVAWGDGRRALFLERFERWARETGEPWPGSEPPRPFQAGAPADLDLNRLGAVIFTGGFRPDYARWVDIPGAFDELGFPLHERCQSSAAKGLHFVGVHFLRKRKSSLFVGVGEDAAMVAEAVAGAERL
jgi:putative flavoprotein involved in K+ transport